MENISLTEGPAPEIHVRAWSAPAPPAPGSSVALVVEDDPRVASTLAMLLRWHGWGVEVAPTVAQAVAKLRRSIPSCVVLDLHLPDGDGEAVLRHVREQGLPTRVVVASGEHEPSRLSRVAALGPDAQFQKPVPFGVLFAAMGGRSAEGASLPVSASV